MLFAQCLNGLFVVPFHLTFSPNRFRDMTVAQLKKVLRNYGQRGLNSLKKESLIIRYCNKLPTTSYGAGNSKMLLLLILRSHTLNIQVIDISISFRIKKIEKLRKQCSTSDDTTKTTTINVSKVR